MSEEEEYSGPASGMVTDMGASIVASALASQLGSDRKYVAQGLTDMRRLTVIKEAEMPFLIYAMLRGTKSRVWKTFYDEFLNLKVSIGGRGRRDIIRMEGVSKGGMVNLESEIMRPGWLGRNVTERDWERRQREERGE